MPDCEQKSSGVHLSIRPCLFCEQVVLWAMPTDSHVQILEFWAGDNISVLALNTSDHDTQQNNI
jgi:hypothetical protein